MRLREKELLKEISKATQNGNFAMLEGKVAKELGVITVRLGIRKDILLAYDHRKKKSVLLDFDNLIEKVLLGK